MCLKEGLYDVPNERKIHKNPIPRLGGVAIWLCTILTFLILVLAYHEYPKGNGLSGILVGGSLIFLLGLVDDLYNLSPKFKLFAQLGAALIAFLLGVKIDFLNNPFGGIVYLGAFALPVTILWIVGISNAMNFIDGVDGLAGTVGIISSITLAVIAVSTLAPSPVSALVASILAGSLMGFLLFNFNPARIFMGDSGALFVGFTLAALSVVGVLKTIAVTLLLPMFILAAPIMDISYSTIRRLLKGKSPFIADSEHIHHKLIGAGLSHNRTVLVFVLMTISAGIIATFLVHAIKLYLSIIFIICIFLLILSFISKHRRNDDEII
ncbi:MAG: MraY family glycosyltransferase [Candidatus Gastranaerophilaceae bacterium]|jgi:UDP-GlcNAc:undecaprenyl-phosphate GlcNAc-1-phosphate transferase